MLPWVCGGWGGEQLISQPQGRKPHAMNGGAERRGPCLSPERPSHHVIFGWDLHAFYQLQFVVTMLKKEGNGIICCYTGVECAQPRFSLGGKEGRTWKVRKGTCATLSSTTQWKLQFQTSVESCPQSGLCIEYTLPEPPNVPRLSWPPWIYSDIFSIAS